MLHHLHTLADYCRRIPLPEFEHECNADSLVFRIAVRRDRLPHDVGVQDFRDRVEAAATSGPSTPTARSASSVATSNWHVIFSMNGILLRHGIRDVLRPPYRPLTLPWNPGTACTGPMIDAASPTPFAPGALRGGGHRRANMRV